MTVSQKGDHMTHIRYIAVATLLALGAMTASAQSLGDYARANRSTKAASQASSNHHYDNDNLPRDTKLSVVGPASVASGSSADAKQPSAESTTSTNTAAAEGSTATRANASEAAQGSKDAQDPKNTKPTSAEDRKKTDEDLQKKINDQKRKIDALNHELDITQREYKLRVATFYADAGERLRNAAQWDKDDAQYKQQIELKQKALDDAR